MTCPECGYMMTAFERDCPRCKDLKAKGMTPAPPVKPPEPPTMSSVPPSATAVSESSIPPPALNPLPHSALDFAQAGYIRCARCAGWVPPGAWGCPQCQLSFPQPVPFSTEILHQQSEHRRRQNAQAAPYTFAAWTFFIMSFLLLWAFPINLLLCALALIMAVIAQSKKSG